MNKAYFITTLVCLSILSMAATAVASTSPGTPKSHQSSAQIRNNQQNKNNEQQSNTDLPQKNGSTASLEDDVKAGMPPR